MIVLLLLLSLIANVLTQCPSVLAPLFDKQLLISSAMPGLNIEYTLCSTLPQGCSTPGGGQMCQGRGCCSVCEDWGSGKACLGKLTDSTFSPNLIELHYTGGDFVNDGPNPGPRETIIQITCGEDLFDNITYTDASEHNPPGPPYIYTITGRSDLACSAACSHNDNCPSEQFCEKSSCLAPTGLCTEAPFICTAEYDPVCGCDGNTYSSSCAAAAAKVNVGSSGECYNTNSCSNNTDCPLSTSYCAKAASSCSDYGFCDEMPEFCASVVDPVCGCDGVTYPSECVAASKGVSVDTPGECPTMPACNANSDCPTSSYCRKAVFGCSSAGVCEPFPAACSDQYDPVCGCDDQTYSSGCEAALAGVSVYVNGECLYTQDCGSDSECTPGQFCKKTIHDCDGNVALGFCMNKPQNCADFHAPVCGCDNIVYTNECLASQAGMNVNFTGASCF